MRKNKPQYFHETIVRDIVDIVSGVSDAVDSDKGLGGLLNRKKSFRSAASATSNLTLVFPVLMSDSLSIESAGIITKAIERKAASMMQMLFSALCIDDATDAIDYVKKYHTNIDTSRGITMDSLIDFLDDTVVNPGLRESVMDRVNKDKEEIAKIIAVEEDAKNNLDFILPDSISENSLNIYHFNPNSDVPVVLDEAISDNYNNYWSGQKSAAEYYSKQLIPSDVKKANELVPTMITINFVSNNDGVPTSIEDVLIGIKAKLYPVTSLDIMNRIKTKNQDRNGFNKFIRATTREISFFKDFLFAIDKAKVDAISQSRRGSSSKLWKVLERRSLKSKLRRSLGMSNDASAISTLVVSKEEVEYLKKTDNINIEDPNIMRPIMESYNLMGVVIVDETQEIASFMFDSGDDMYEQISFNNLERESNDGSSKKIVNLLTKVAR